MYNVLRDVLRLATRHLNNQTQADMQAVIDVTPRYNLYIQLFNNASHNNYHSLFRTRTENRPYINSAHDHLHTKAWATWVRGWGDDDILVNCHVYKPSCHMISRRPGRWPSCTALSQPASQCYPCTACAV